MNFTAPQARQERRSQVRSATLRYLSGVAQMGTHYSHVKQADRISIQALMQAKLNGSENARQLNFSRSTIHREINRSKTSLTALAANYQAGIAQVRSQANRRAGGTARRKLGSDTASPLWRIVLSGLHCRWSPQQIAGKLPRMNKAAIPAQIRAERMEPKPTLLSVSHETTYAMPSGTMRTELVELLRKGHKARLPRSRSTDCKGGLPDITNISLRPLEVAPRIVPGQWEGDLIKGAMNHSSVGSLVERHIRYTMRVKLDGNTAQDVLDGFKRRLKSVPASLRKTMTYDQGSEMVLHETLSADLNMDIYFCDPPIPSQRGSNENANDLVREFLPKGMDLSHQQLAHIEHLPNQRPRKIFKFHSPHEMFSLLTSNHIADIALQV